MIQIHGLWLAALIELVLILAVAAAVLGWRLRAKRLEITTPDELMDQARKHLEHELQRMEAVAADPELSLPGAVIQARRQALATELALLEHEGNAEAYWRTLTAGYQDESADPEPNQAREQAWDAPATDLTEPLAELEQALDQLARDKDDADALARAGQAVATMRRSLAA